MPMLEEHDRMEYVALMRRGQDAGVVVALMLAWMYADAAPRGDLMAGIVTGCGVI